MSKAQAGPAPRQSLRSSSSKKYWAAGGTSGSWVHEGDACTRPARSFDPKCIPDRARCSHLEPKLLPVSPRTPALPAPHRCPAGLTCQAAEFALAQLPQAARAITIGERPLARLPEPRESQQLGTPGRCPAGHDPGRPASPSWSPRRGKCRSRRAATPPPVAPRPHLLGLRGHLVRGPGRRPARQPRLPAR